jgi:hypothetical protein
MLDHARMWFLITNAGRRIPLPTLPTTIGSEAASGICLEDPSVKPRHARLLPGDNTSLRLEACEGALVEVDGWAITETDLHAGDELLVGQVHVRLERDKSKPEKDSAEGQPRSQKRPSPPRSASHSAPLSPARPAPGVGVNSASMRTPNRRHSSPARRDQASLRRGLLHADTSQLSVGTRCILGLALLLIAAAIVWAMQALVLALA